MRVIYVNYILLQTSVQMVTFVWLVAGGTMKGVWRCVIMECGAPSVMTCGVLMMLVWSVDN